jgi:outer membrane lipoprotein carrier protein
MPIKRFVLALCLALSPLLARADSAEAQLRHFIEQVSSAQGQFSQQTLSQGQSKPAQSGQFSFMRPGRFKWQVTQPYQQLVVSDGKTLIQYDPDLAQMTQRDVSQSIGASPAAILFGSGSLDQAFTLKPLADQDNLAWLRATPRTADAGFRYVDLGFADNLPVKIIVHDSFGQKTAIVLSHIQPNPKLSPNEFTFKAPAGVDRVTLQ